MARSKAPQKKTGTAPASESKARGGSPELTKGASTKASAVKGTPRGGGKEDAKSISKKR